MGPVVEIGTRVTVESKQAERQIKNFEKSMSSIKSEKTVFMELQFEGSDKIKERLEKAIAGIKGIKFDIGDGKMADILGIKDAQKALSQLETQMKSVTGRKRTSLDTKRSLVSEYISAHDDAIREYTKVIRGNGRAVASFQALGEEYNKGRKVDVRNINENLEIAKQNGNLREQLSLLLRKQKILEKIDKTNKAAESSPELVQTRNEIAAIQKKIAAQKNVNSLLSNQGSILSSLTRLASRYFSVFAIAKTVDNMAKTAGYFQQQQVALEGILGSATKARQALDQIKSLALESPFQTKDLVTYTKQLSAFGVDSEKLVSTMSSLADISAGLGVDMGRIILAYGQVKSAAVLRGQELRQFTEAGIPMVEALSKKLSEANGRLVTTGEVFKFISERKVPFEMVASVLSDMTAEGGKFYKMQENLTDTLFGQIEKLKDVWTLALNDVGDSFYPILRKSLDFVSALIKNIKVLGLGISAAFSAKAANNFYKSLKSIDVLTLKMPAHISRIRKWIDETTDRTRKWQLRMISLRMTMRSFASFMTSSGLGLAIIGALAAGIGAAIQRARELNKAFKEIDSTYTRETSKLIDGFDKLVSKLHGSTVGTKAFNDALSSLKTNYGDYLNDDMVKVLSRQEEGWVKIADQVRNTIREVQEYGAALERAKKAGQITEERFTRDDFVDILLKRGTAANYIRAISYTFGNANNNAGVVNKRFGLSGDDSFTDEDIANFVRNEEKAISLINLAISNFFSNNGKNVDDLRESIKSLYGDASLKKVLSAFADGIYKQLSNSKEYQKYFDNLEQAENSPLNVIKRNLDEANKAAALNAEGLFEGKKESAEYIKMRSTSYNPIRWEDARQDELIKATVKTAATLFGEEAGNSLNKAIIGKTESGKPAEIVNALSEFGETLKDERLITILNNLISEYKKTARVESREEVKQVNDRIRGVLQGNYTPEQKDFYRAYFASDDSYEAMVQKVRSDRADRENFLKENKRGTGGQATRYARNEREKIWLDDLFGRIYVQRDKEKGGGGAGGGGWQRFLADLFSYIKEARAEEKKLVEHSAGLTEDLANQINSDQLQGTAVDAFWESMQKGGSPFKKIIDKMDEYGIESTFFDKDFLKGALSDIVTQTIKSTGTVDFQNVWNQLIQVINKRADELLKNTSTKKLGESIKAYAQQATVEGEKYFGRDAVQKLIEDQLKELRKINGQFENIRSTQNAINSIRGASNAYRAYGALGSRGYTSSAEVTRQQLSALLGAKGGQGLSMATPLAQLINGGSLGINSISQILAIKESLAGITTKDMQGDDEAARQANFEEFKGVLGQFDSLLGQLTNDILEDFKRIMAARDPFMKAGDDIVNAFDEYSKTIALIAHGLANGDIDKSRRYGMMVQATQNLYTAVAKSMGGDGMPEYINRLFPEFGTATGTSNRGFELGMWLGNGSLTNKVANYAANKAGLNPDDYDTEKEFLEAVDKAANGVLKFAAKMELASAIVQKVDSYIQKSAQFANKLIDALDANNGLVKDEYGNYTYENDYSTAKEAINMISEFSSGISSAFQSLLSGDIFGAITGIGTAIAGFFENLFGIGDSQIQKQQDKIISANKSLERAMTNLQHTLQDVAGKDKWDNLTDQIANLREQQSNNKELENLEVSKKHGDADKAESFRSASEEAMREAENTIRQIREEVLGVADDIAGQFTDAFTEAFRNGENLARAWRDSVRSYIADTLKDVLLKSVVAPRINDIFKKFGIEEGKTSSSDIIAMMSDPTKMKEFRNDLFAEGTFLQDWLTGLPKEIQEMIGYNGSTSELSGGIQGITEDTARTLEGLSNSILAQHVITNRYLSDMAVSGFAQVQLSWFTDMQNLQRQIAANTQTVSDVLTGSRDGIRSLQVRIE